MADSFRTPSGDEKKRSSSWLVFLLPVLVSAAVMFACGAVFLTAEDGSEDFGFGTGADSLANEDNEHSSEFGLRLGSPAVRRTVSPLDRSSQQRSPAPRRGQPTDQSAAPGSEDEDVDWELEMADSEEVEPTPEMIEQARQRIREGRGSFGFAGRPGARLAETLRKGVAERRAERQAENSEPDSSTDRVESDEDTESSLGTAGAGPR